MNWLEVAVHTPTEGIEIISFIFEDLGTGGVAIDDPALIYKYIESGVWDYWEFPDEVLNREMPIVKGYFPATEAAEQKVTQLKERLSKLDLKTKPKIYVREIKEEDWATAWQAYYKPVKVGQRFIVKPTWEEIKVEPNQVVLEMDPGMAFGSGTHATTTMCLEFIEDCIIGGEMVCDVGTGTGILAIAAAKVGAKKVLAVDVDEVAVKVAKENIAGNMVADKVQVVQGNLLDHFAGEADVIIANIVADVIIKLAPDALEALRPGGYLITSGIIRDRAEEVLSALQQTGFKLQGQRHQGEWVALLLTKVRG
ncbi:50S ribosomal protein L11 methyltransferase [Peptococcaceae bacterium 1198_IL3148]